LEGGGVGGSDGSDGSIIVVASVSVSSVILVDDMRADWRRSDGIVSSFLVLVLVILVLKAYDGDAINIMLTSSTFVSSQRQVMVSVKSQR
jgi:hypothetical protein